MRYDIVCSIVMSRSTIEHHANRLLITLKSNMIINLQMGSLSHDNLTSFLIMLIIVLKVQPFIRQVIIINQN